MPLKQTTLHLPKNVKELKGKAKTGVSLHCHTQHSKEMLDFVPHYANKLPVISFFWKREQVKYLARTGKKIDFSDAFWLPPMSEKQVFDIETEQINEAGLDAIVSLTDHDRIDANLAIAGEVANEAAPISMEWTVPYSFGFFHVGIHNIPKDDPESVTEKLLEFTFVEESRKPGRLDELFQMLTEIPGLLIVLNHPLWDIELVGKVRHRELLSNFLQDHGRWIHAFEVNGYRAWSENKAVIELAEAWDIPLVTGGDRHGCQPNTVINLTNAKSFGEFAEEVRVDKHTEVVLMPEYKAPLHSRQLQSFSEILKYYPEFPEGRQRWFDRIHYDVLDGNGVRPVSVHWDRGGPAWLRAAVWTLGVVGQPTFRPFFKMFMKAEDRVPAEINRKTFKIQDKDAETTPALTPGSVPEAP